MRNTILLLSLISLSLGMRAGLPEKTAPGDATKKIDAVNNNDAAKSDSKRWKKGFIVTLKGDTISGKIKTLDFLDVYYDYQHMVSFRDEKGMVVSQYMPKDLKSFSFYDDQTSMITLQAVSSPDGDGLVFLRLYYNGPCKVYGLTVTDVKSASGNEDVVSPSLIPKEKKYLQIGGSQFFPIKRAGFRKNMKEVFSSCPRIVAGLDSKEYTYEKWQTLVRDYNQQYK